MQKNAYIKCLDRGRGALKSQEARNKFYKNIDRCSPRKFQN